MEALSRSIITCILFLVTTVSCQDRVQAFIGDDVPLPCTYSQGDKLPPDSNAFWRTADDVNVYDILRNEPDLSSQDRRFRDRVSSFPEQYRNGNFSVVLREVGLPDSGRYDCFIPAVNFQRHVDLSVTGKRMEPKTTSAPVSVPEGRGGGTAVRSNILSLLLVLLFGQKALLCGHLC